MSAASAQRKTYFVAEQSLQQSVTILMYDMCVSDDAATPPLYFWQIILKLTVFVDPKQDSNLFFLFRFVKPAIVSAC